MRTLASIALLVTCAATAAAQKPARTEVRGWPLDMDGMIRIHNYNGTVTVTGWDRDSVAMTAVVAGKMGTFGGGTRRGVKMGLESASTTSVPIADFTVFVPSRARLSIRGAATTIEVRNFAGTVDASTLSGRVKIAGAVTEITAETMDGDLEIEASPSYLRGKTATGRVTWTGSSDDVALSTVSGTIAVTGSVLYRARVESISGDLKFTGTVKPEGHAGFDTHGGDITLSLSTDTRAELIVESPLSTLLGSVSRRAPGTPGQTLMSVPRGAPRGTIHPADITLRSFKGKVTVTQPLPTSLSRPQSARASARSTAPSPCGPPP